MRGRCRSANQTRFPGSAGGIFIIPRSQVTHPPTVHAFPRNRIHKVIILMSSCSQIIAYASVSMVVYYVCSMGTIRSTCNGCLSDRYPGSIRYAFPLSSSLRETFTGTSLSMPSCFIAHLSVLSLTTAAMANAAVRV